MEKEEVKEDKSTQRTEEITDIIERMPNTFAKKITMLVCFIVILLIFFGYVVRYPDIVTGEGAISAEQAPLQLVSEQSGRLRINNIRSQDSIVTGQLLAWIDNPAHPEMVKQIKIFIKDVSLPVQNARALYIQLPKNLNLGDLTIPYSSFLSLLNQLADYQDNKLYDKQTISLKEILGEQQAALETLKDKESLSLENLRITDKTLERDSLLLLRKIISQEEFERSLASRINAEDHVKSSIRNLSAIREQMSNTQNSIQQNRISKSEKEMQLDLELLTAYNNLIDKIGFWEKQYLITSPMSGKAQFLKFWNENQFVQAGEPIFSIVPAENGILGKVSLPISGAGKVKVGQEAIIKLADFPYMEYGYIKARVKDIALVSSVVNVGNGNTAETYLVTIDFPDGLTTNYGTTLDFKFEAKGTAEIITKDRRLIERFFDNLKYIGHSK